MAEPLDELDVPTLRARRDAVRAEEAAVSYRRRLLQAQLDIVAGFDDEHAEALERRLVELLADVPSDGDRDGPSRAVETVVEGVEEPAPLPEDLAGMDAEERAALVERLTEQERELSARRRELLDELDRLQAELVTRYREGGVDTASILGGSS